MMKQIVMFVRPHRRKETEQALEDAGARGLTVTECYGWQRMNQATEPDQSEGYDLGRCPMVRIAVTCSATAVDGLISACCESASTGQPGDGLIVVLPLETAYRLRTGEIGMDAI